MRERDGGFGHATQRPRNLSSSCCSDGVVGLGAAGLGAVVAGLVAGVAAAGASVATGVPVAARLALACS